jgi:hypothetical protein
VHKRGLNERTDTAMRELHLGRSNTVRRPVTPRKIHDHETVPSPLSVLYISSMMSTDMTGVEGRAEECELQCAGGDVDERLASYN